MPGKPAFNRTEVDMCAAAYKGLQRLCGTFGLTYSIALRASTTPGRWVMAGKLYLPAGASPRRQIVAQEREYPNPDTGTLSGQLYGLVGAMDQLLTDWAIDQERAAKHSRVVVRPGPRGGMEEVDLPL